MNDSGETNVLIRPLTEADLLPSADCYVAAFGDPALGEDWNTGSALQLLDYWFKRQPDLAFIAEVAGKVVGGFIVGVKPWWDGNHLVEGELFVVPEHQGHGIGSRLLREVLSVAGEKYNPVYWETHTFKGQGHPLSWYKRLGFTEIAEWTMIRADLTSIQSELSKRR